MVRTPSFVTYRSIGHQSGPGCCVQCVAPVSVYKDLIHPRLHSYKYYKLLIPTQSPNNLIQFSVSSDSLLRSSVCGQVDNAPLCCVSHNAGSVLRPFVMTWSPPHLFPVSLSLSHLSSLLRAQPSRVIPSSSSVASRE